MNDVKSGFAQSKCMTNIDSFFAPFLYLYSTFILYLDRHMFTLRTRACGWMQINQPDATVLQVYYLTFCVAQRVLGVSTPIIRSLQLH